MLLLKRTHTLIVSQLQARISDLKEENQQLRELIQSAHQRQVELVDRALAASKPQAAAVLHPRPVVAAPVYDIPDVSIDEPPAPDDIESWLRATNQPPKTAS